MKYDPNKKYDSIDSVLRRRGYTPKRVGALSSTLLPLHDKQVVTGKLLDDFRQAFGSDAFRKVVRTILKSKGAPVAIELLRGSAGGKADSYVELLEACGVIHIENNGSCRVVRSVDNIGSTLEWYVADLCEGELCGTAEWSVLLDDLPSIANAGGDYDVLAWLDPNLVYIETKSSPARGVSEDELRQFLQRSQNLAPDLAILLIDTQDDLTELLERIEMIILPPLRKASGLDESYRPPRPIIHSQASLNFPSVNFGMKRHYVVNSKPSILSQIRRCLQHHNHSMIKDAMLTSAEPINWITGEVLESP